MSLLAGLISYWKFDEAAGTAPGNSAIDSVGSNTLTANSSSGPIGSGTGIINGSRTIVSANNNFFNIASNASLHVGNSSASWAGWANVSDTGAVQTIIRKWNAAPEYIVRIHAGFLEAFVEDSTTAGFTAGVPVPVTNAWFFWSVVYDNVAGTLSVSVNNGIPVVATGIGSSLRVGADDYTMGATGSGSETMDGAMDEIAFWKRALTATEISVLHNGGVGYPLSGFGAITPAIGFYAGYDCDESSGSMADILGVLSASVTNSVGSATGKIDGARSFVRTSIQYAVATPVAALTELSFSAWVNLSSISTGIGSQPILGMMSGTTIPSLEYSGILGVTPAGKAIAYVYDGAGESCEGTSTLSTGVWYHLVATFNKGSAKIYVNGTLETTITIGTPYSSWSQTPAFGIGLISGAGTSDQSFGASFDGLMDMVYVWSRQLADAEVALLFNNGNGLQYSNFNRFPTRQPSQRFDALPEYNFVVFEQFRKQPIIAIVQPKVPVSRALVPPRSDALPDFNYSSYEQRRLTPIPTPNTPIGGAAAFVQSAQAGIVSTTFNLTPSASVSSGNLLILMVTQQGTISNLTITDSNSNAWKIVPCGYSVNLASGGATTVQLSMWYVFAGSSGSNVVTVTAASSNQMRAAFHEYSGVTGFGNSAKATGLSNNPAAGVIASQLNLVVTCFDENTDTAIVTAPSGYTIRQSVSPTQIFTADKLSSPGGAEKPVFTDNNGDGIPVYWNAITATFFGPPPASPTYQYGHKDSQRSWLLPDFNYREWQQSRHWPVPIAGPVPMPPSTKQGSQRLDPLPDFNYREWQQSRRWPVPRGLIQDPPPTRQRSQRFDSIPDLTFLFWEQFRKRQAPSGYFVTQEGYSGIFLPFTTGEAGRAAIANTSSEGYAVYVGVNGMPDLQAVPRGFSTTFPVSIVVSPPIPPVTHPFYDIIAADSASGTFTLSGLAPDIADSDPIQVVGSSSNDGNYTVANIGDDGSGNQVIRTIESIPSDTGDGTLRDTAPTGPTPVITQTLWVVVRKRNKYGVYSQNQNATLMVIDSNGLLVLPVVLAPTSMLLNPSSGNQIRLLAKYSTYSNDPYPATQWKVWVDTVTPNTANTPTLTVPVLSESLVASLVGPYTPGTYFVSVGLYRAGDAQLGPVTTATVVIPTVPTKPTAVPGGFNTN